MNSLWDFLRHATMNPLAIDIFFSIDAVLARLLLSCLTSINRSSAMFQGSVQLFARVFRNVRGATGWSTAFRLCLRDDHRRQYPSLSSPFSHSLSLSLPPFPSSLFLPLSLSFPVEFPRRKLRNGRATAVTVTPDGNWHALPAYITFASTYDLCQLRTTDIDCSPGFSTSFE